MSKEANQLLIAAEALVLFAKRIMNKIDKDLKVAKKWQGEEMNDKTRDRFMDCFDSYMVLYDNLYMTIEDLKRIHNPKGVDVFISRHLQPVLDLLGDRIKESEKYKRFWQLKVLKPMISAEDEVFLKNSGIKY